MKPDRISYVHSLSLKCSTLAYLGPGPTPAPLFTKPVFFGEEILSSHKTLRSVNKEK